MQDIDLLECWQLILFNDSYHDVLWNIVETRVADAIISPPAYWIQHELTEPGSKILTEDYNIILDTDYENYFIRLTCTDGHPSLSISTRNKTPGDAEIRRIEYLAMSHIE